MAKCVFVTGGSGFVGSAVIDELVVRHWQVRALVHERPLPERGGKVASIPGGLFDAQAVSAAIKGCDAVIHLVGIIAEKPGKGMTFERIHVEGTRAMVTATRQAQIRRYVQMSALGARDGAPSRYHRTKSQAEDIVRDSGLDWTIFRPSLIHGPRGDFMRTEARWARKTAAPFLFMPYFGAGLFGAGGAGKLQPVHGRDVARAFVDSLEKPATVANTYDLVGAQQVTWPQMHHLASQAIVGKRRWAAPIPAWWAKLLTRIVPGSLLPFNRDQVLMSQEDNIGDPTAFGADFGWIPRGFAESLSDYASAL